jgi:hypothetical protein
MDRWERVCEPFHQKFFHKPRGMLNASSPQRFRAGGGCGGPSFAVLDKKQQVSKTHISSVFSKSPKKSRTFLRVRAAQRVARVASARRSATSGVDARASTLHYAKTLVFLSRCSNPNAVFAIPAGTVRHRHSLMARRAAWRRSERRRRSRRRKRAQGRPSAGRRSKHAPASQSSASNDVDDCVKRAGASRRAVSASRSRFDTAGPGRRRRASARQGSSFTVSAQRRR